MLFFLAMDALGFLFAKAENDGLLQSLSTRMLYHRVSFYVDNVVLFLRPIEGDISITINILDIFGEVSDLRNNVQKSSVLPIRCDEEEKNVVQQFLPCQLLEFPCWYLGLPLTLKKPTRDQIQPFIDKIGDQMPEWKADLLSKLGRKILVQYVFTSMIIYLATAVDITAWGWKAMDKFRRSFFWRGHEEAKGGHCQVAGATVCRPMQLGGLGFSRLKELGWALQMRWPWLENTDPNRPWSALPICMPDKVQAFFLVAMQAEIGDGSSTLFWQDEWLHGQRLLDFTPRLVAAIPKRRFNQ
jgi:hypothetical protein